MPFPSIGRVRGRRRSRVYPAPDVAEQAAARQKFDVVPLQGKEFGAPREEVIADGEEGAIAGTTEGLGLGFNTTVGGDRYLGNFGW